MYTHCIVGAGVSGLILLLLLAEADVPLESIILIDPYFDGGDLANKWSTVLSNTPWSVTYNSLKQYLPKSFIPAWASALPLDKPTTVFEISRLIREMATQRFSSIKMVQGLVKKAVYDTNWSVHIQKDTVAEIIQSSKVYFTFGSTPKQLDLSIPTIPLEVALDVHRLRQYIQPKDKIIVFGTAHSGVLVLKNMADCNAQTVGIYRGVKPFVYARDGAYDGIKLDGAVYADEITEGKYPTIKLVQMANISDIIRETRSATWCVYATGFEQRNTIYVEVNGECKDLRKYSATSGMLTDCPNAWGFGIAYPSQAPDGIHFDVGVSSFLEHIHRQLIILKDT